MQKIRYRVCIQKRLIHANALSFKVDMQQLYPHQKRFYIWMKLRAELSSLDKQAPGRPQ